MLFINISLVLHILHMKLAREIATKQCLRFSAPVRLFASNRKLGVVAVNRLKRYCTQKNRS